MVNSASADYLAKYGVPRNLEDLQKHWMVGYMSSTLGHEVPWEYTDPTDKVQGIGMHSKVLVYNVETYLACSIAGLGLIQVPRYDVQQLLARGGLVEVLPEWLPQAMSVTALYPHRHQKSRRLTVFIDWPQSLLLPLTLIK